MLQNAIMVGNTDLISDKLNLSLPQNILRSLKRNYRDDFQVHLLDEPTDLFRKSSI